MRLCRHCGTVQPDEAFARAAVVKGKLYYRRQCNQCKKAREARRVATIAAWLRDYKKGSCCVRCNFADTRALAFHHRDRWEKAFNIGEACRRQFAITTIREEIAKCIVLCFNCHAIEHFNERLAAGTDPLCAVLGATAGLTDEGLPRTPLVGTTKVCRYCLVEQDESFFEVCKVIGDRSYRRHKCRSCKRATQRCRRGRLRDWLEAFKKSLRCTECGFNDFRAIEFHHLNSEEKDFAIGEMVKDNRSIAAIEREIAKCVALCANCHRITHCNEGDDLFSAEPVALATATLF